MSLLYHRMNSWFQEEELQAVFRRNHLTLIEKSRRMKLVEKVVTIGVWVLWCIFSQPGDSLLRAHQFRATWDLLRIRTHRVYINWLNECYIETKDYDRVQRKSSTILNGWKLGWMIPELPMKLDDCVITKFSYSWDY